MGRKPYKNRNLPTRLAAHRQKSGRVFYYYVVGGKARKRIPLGSDYALAVRKWAELEMNTNGKLQAVVTFRYAAERYLTEVVPTKAPRTQQDNPLQLKFLYQFFDNPPAPLDQIEPATSNNIWTGVAKDPRLKRIERKRFSLTSGIALGGWGYTTFPNPCQGIKGFREVAMCSTRTSRLCMTPLAS